MLKIYHNPRCSHSRQALQLLRAAGLQAEIIEYAKVGLKREEIEMILAKSALNIRDLLRQKEALVRQHSHEDDAFLMALLLREPQLLQRPIVMNDERAILARPPEKVLDLI